MARRRFENFRPGALLLAFLISLFLWAIAQAETNIERIFDAPIELQGLDDTLVVTGQSVDAVNISVSGSRAALRNLDEQISYPIDLSGAKRGVFEHEVPFPPVDLPRNAKPVSRSPSRISVHLERKGRKSVAVRADVMGEPPAGFQLVNIDVEPALVRLVGARNQVMNLVEVSTEPVDLSELTETTEREARIYLGPGTIWMEDKKPVTVRIEIEPVPEPETDAILGDLVGAADGEAPATTRLPRGPLVPGAATPQTAPAAPAAAPSGEE